MKHTAQHHCTVRICQRCVTRLNDILKWIDEEKFIPLGYERGTDRSHELMYLPLDNFWFVLVRDIKKHELITFLPIDYHNRWRISQEAKDMAKSLMESPEIKKVKEKKKNKEHKKQKPVCIPEPIKPGYQLVYTVFDWQNKCAKKLMTFAPEDFTDKMSLFKDYKTFFKITERLLEKGINPEVYEVGIGCKNGRSDEPVFRHYSEITKDFDKEQMKAIDGLIKEKALLTKQDPNAIKEAF